MKTLFQILGVLVVLAALSISAAILVKKYDAKRYKRFARIKERIAKKVAEQDGAIKDYRDEDDDDDLSISFDDDVDLFSGMDGSEDNNGLSEDELEQMLDK